jgi:hypothetical protein
MTTDLKTTVLWMEKPGKRSIDKNEKKLGI